MAIFGEAPDEECEQKGEFFLCRKTVGKRTGAVLMKVTKDGPKIERHKGDPQIVDDLIKRMEEKLRIKSKTDL